MGTGLTTRAFGPPPGRGLLALLAVIGVTTVVATTAAVPAHAPVAYDEEQGQRPTADDRAAELLTPELLASELLTPEQRTAMLGQVPSDIESGNAGPRRKPRNGPPASPPGTEQGPGPTSPPSGDGRTTTNSCAVAPTFPTQPRTRFGTSISTSEKLLPESLAEQEKRFGRMGAIRTYDPTIPPDGAWSRRSAAVGDRMLVHSFRMPPAEVLSGQHDTALRAWFREAPKAPLILWNYIHEPEVLVKEGAFTTDTYRRAFRHVATIAGALCRDNLYPTMVLTGWTAHPQSGRNWRDYYAGDEYVSVVAWDPYNSASVTPTKYEAPEKLFRHVVVASQQSGKPYGIAETGSELISGDGAGRNRAVWLDRTAQWFSDNNAQFVTYFQSTRDGDFILLDEPSVNAWSTWVARGRK